MDTDRTSRSRFFGMVTTQHSSDYTDHALRTFFAHTPMRAEDRFLLIDNDHSYESDVWKLYPQIEVVKKSRPGSFAENMNQAMEEAKECKSDLFFLNNDLIFTPGWLDPLLDNSPKILSPLGNQQVQHKSERVVWKNALSLSTYTENQDEFDRLMASLPEPEQNRISVLILGFFCVKIPFTVYRIVGPLSTEFGVGGAEDTDYCLRAHLRGIPVQFASRSFVLHFNQRSTGAVEPESETRSREERYRSVFRSRWGDALTRLALFYDQSILSDKTLTNLAAQGDFQAIIKTLLAREGREAPRS